MWQHGQIPQDGRRYQREQETNDGFDGWKELSEQPGSQLLGYNEQYGVGQRPVEGIQKELGNSFAQVLGGSSRHHKALSQVVTVPKKQLRHLPHQWYEGIAEIPETEHHDGQHSHQYLFPKTEYIGPVIHAFAV